MGAIYIISFYIEAFLIFKIEKARWNTIYTPINLLMIPYAILLPISIISLNIKVGYTFFYPSILIWIIGLFLFEIPSYILSSKNNHRVYKPARRIQIPKKILKWYERINILIVILFILRFLQVSRSGFPVGSDEFGEAFATYGIWGHLNLFLMVFTIGDIILLKRNSRNFFLMLFLIIAGSAVCFLNQVKGWVLIPIIAGIIIRLKLGSLQLKPKLIFLICATGTSLFFLSYYVALVLIRDGSDTSWFWSFFVEHFIFYLTSGINGLSECCRHLNLDGNLINAISKIFYPLQIIIEILTDGLSPVSHGVFLNIAYGESNVRTIFGDFFLRGGVLGGTIFVLFNSLVCYFMLWLTQHTSSLFINIAYGFMSGILAMGWFSSYTHLLNSYEVPIFCLGLYFVQRTYEKKRTLMILKR